MKHHMKRFCQLYKLYRLIIICVVQIYAAESVYAADHSLNDSIKLAEIKCKLDSLVKRAPEYMSETDISVGEISLHELLRGLALINQLNISIKGNESLKVSCNFTRARINELLYFLCKEYHLNLDIIGNIVSVYPDKENQSPTEAHISYNAKDSTISLDFINKPLYDIIKSISKESSSNIILPQKLYNTRVSAYIEQLPLDDALMSLAQINNLGIEKESNNVWSINELVVGNKSIASNKQHFKHKSFPKQQLSIDSLGNIIASISNGNVYDIICDVCNKLKINHFFINTPNFTTSLYLNNVSITTFLNTLFTGTNFSYYNENGIYFFGNTHNSDDMISTSVIPLKHRSVEDIDVIIPNKLRENIHIELFRELNCIIACGESKKISRIISFINEIDKIVPLITIDIIIAESTKSRTDENGITLKKENESLPTTGTLSPGIDLTLGSSTINRLLNSFNGFGSIKLGKVPETFYASLKFLESNGDIIVESTPKLSTLNGREAILTSGETQYYKEVNNSYMGTQNPVQSTSYMWKSIDANLTVKITPYVSTDSLITLNIDISQSEFTSRVEKDSPPGIVVRSFKSIIRVANNEMVLLGGIERNSKEKSSSGIPFISRIPILKWIFGNSKNNKNESKLNVFIKPTLLD